MEVSNRKVVNFNPIAPGFLFDVFNSFYKRYASTKSKPMILCVIVKPNKYLKFILYNEEISVLKFWEIEFNRIFETYPGNEREFFFQMVLNSKNLKQLRFVLKSKKFICYDIEFNINKSGKALNFILKQKPLRKSLLSDIQMKIEILKSKFPRNLKDRVKRLLNYEDFNFYLFVNADVFKMIKELISVDSPDCIFFKFKDNLLYLTGKSINLPFNIPNNIRNIGFFALESVNYQIEKRLLSLYDFNDTIWYFNRKGIIIVSKNKGYKVFIGKNTGQKKKL